jgi:cytochrome c556
MPDAYDVEEAAIPLRTPIVAEAVLVRMAGTDSRIECPVTPMTVNAARRFVCMKTLALSLAILSISGVLGANAQGPPSGSADDLVLARKSGMEVQASVIAAILQAIGTSADISQFAGAGDAMAAWSQTIPELFPAGTEAGNDTQARPAVWSDRAGFEKAAAILTAAAQSMAKAAAAGNQSEFIRAFRATSLACASCHVTFRSGRN